MSPISFFIFLSLLPGVNLTPVYDFGNTTQLEQLNQNIAPEWNVSANAGAATVKMTLVGFPDIMCQRNGTCWTRDHEISRLIYKRSEVTLPEDTESTMYYLNSVTEEPEFILTADTIVLRLKVIVKYTIETLETVSCGGDDGDGGDGDGGGGGGGGGFYPIPMTLSLQDDGDDDGGDGDGGGGETCTVWVPHEYEEEVVLVDTISKPQVYVSPPYEIRVTVTNNTPARIARSDSDMFNKYMFGFWITGTETFTYEDPIELKLKRTEITNTTGAWLKVMRVRPYYNIERQRTRYIGLITSYNELDIHGVGMATYEGEVVTHNTTIDNVWDLGPYGWIKQGSPVTYSKKEYSTEPLWAFLVALILYAIIIGTIFILAFVIGPRLLAEFL